MADEILRLGIDGRPAREGAAEVKRALDDVKKSAEGAAEAVDDLGGTRGVSGGGLLGLGGRAAAATAAVGTLATGIAAVRIAISQGARITGQWADELDRIAYKGEDVNGQVLRIANAFDILERSAQRSFRGATANLLDLLSGRDGRFDFLERRIQNANAFFGIVGAGFNALGRDGLQSFVPNASAAIDRAFNESVPLSPGGGRFRENRLLGSVTEFSDNLLSESQRAERERFDNLVRATELRRAETDELRELLRLSLQYSAELEQGNVSLARRVELAERLRQINGAFTPTGGIAGAVPQSGFLGVNAPGSVSLSPGNAAILAGIQARNAQGAQRAIAEAESARSLVLFTAGLDEAAFQLSQFSPELGRFVSGIADVLAGIQRSRAGGIEGALGTIGIVGAGIGLAAQIGRALFGGGQEESPAQREMRRIQSENNRRLADLTQGIARLDGSLLGSVRGGQFAEAQAFLGRFFRGDPEAVAGLDDVFGDLQAVARALDLELVRTAESLAVLREALKTDFLEQISNTFEGRFGLLQDRFAILGIDDPQQRFDALLREIQDLVSGDLGAEIGGLTRDNFRTFAEEFLDRLRAGDESLLADIGQTSLPAFLTFLRAAAGELDGFGDAISEATDALRNVPEVFKVAASTFLASDSRDPIFRPVGTGGDGSRIEVHVHVDGSVAGMTSQAIREKGGELAEVVGEHLAQAARRGGTTAFDLAVGASSRSGSKGAY